MATSIINYKGNFINVNDNILIFSLYYLRMSSSNFKLPAWYIDYTTKVINVIIDVKPIGWGYLDLEEYLINKKRKQFFIKMLRESIVFFDENRISKIDSSTANNILKIEGDYAWKDSDFLNINYLKDFITKLIMLLIEK